MTTAKLATLLNSHTLLADNLNRNVTGLTLDSRQVQPGDLFFAYKGNHVDGRAFIADAIAKGAVAIVTEAEDEALSTYVKQNVPIIPIKNLTHQISHIAANFYGHPAKALRIIGITGTNGKTSCSHFVAAALHQLGIACGVIGTLGHGMFGAIEGAGLNTTPDPITLQATFAHLVKEGAQAVAMEVSSHSIDQGRINGVEFEVGIFTNLTRDHLDYHGDMKTYGSVKKRLFDNPLLQQAVINVDDHFGQTLLTALQQQKPTYAYGAQPQADIAVPLTYAQNVKMEINGLRAHVHTPWGSGELHAALIGQFNLSNVLAVLTTLCVMKIPFAKALAALAHLEPVAGRMQMLGGKNQPLLVVDYAHTPDALEKALIALREHCHGRLYCVFGCGGDRDKGKRPLMAKTAEQYADQVVVTDDNPRHEDPAAIVADIMQGFSARDKVIVQHDRSKAIEYIIQCAKVGDCILIAGKGAETYQQIGDTKLAFSDVEKVNLFLEI